MGKQKTRCHLCSALNDEWDYVDFNQSGNDYFINERTFDVSPIIVKYYHCSNCSLIYTDHFNNWTIQDFEKNVYNDEYILADPPFTGERPDKLCKIVNALLFNSSDRKDLKIIDYGGGEGALKQRLNLLGYSNVTSYDPIYSKDPVPNEDFDVVTCFEVVEHIIDQDHLWKQLIKLMGDEGIIIFSTLLAPPDIANLKGSWWYICPRNGHLSMFSDETLKYVSNNYGLHITSLTEQLHIGYILNDVLDMNGLVDKLPSILSEI